MLKYVWIVQDDNSMEVGKVYTAKKAAFAVAKQTYGNNGIFHKVCDGCYWYKPRAKYADPYCHIEQVPVMHTKRKGAEKR